MFSYSWTLYGQNMLNFTKTRKKTTTTVETTTIPLDIRWYDRSPLWNGTREDVTGVLFETRWWQLLDGCLTIE